MAFIGLFQTCTIFDKQISRMFKFYYCIQVYLIIRFVQLPINPLSANNTPCIFVQY